MNIISSHSGDTAAGDWFQIDPAASTDTTLVDAATGKVFPSPCAALKVLGTGGTIQCVSLSGRVIPWDAETGELIPLRIAGIRAAGTTATGIWALY